MSRGWKGHLFQGHNELWCFIQGETSCQSVGRFAQVHGKFRRCHFSALLRLSPSSAVGELVAI